jgi:Fe-S cluster assembly protein SufD
LNTLHDAELQRYASLLTLDARWQAHPFAQLSEASLQDGWVVTVSAGKRIEQPIVIEQWADSAESFAASLRILVVIERGAEATLVQLCDTPRDTGKCLLNSLVQVHVQDNASLQHIQLQMADEACHQVQVTQATLHRDSRYQHYLVTLGTTLVRNDLHLQFMATGAEATLNGAFLSKHAQHVDNHLNLEHISGRCQSSTRYKGLITDQSRAVFNGRIHIHPNAQKTDAQLNNKNLLLSREAEIDTKPELEIYADDVKCAHGASIGQLDEKALFYFESRGIDKATAEAMLSFGFINEIVETLPVPGLAESVKQRLMTYFRDVKQLEGLCEI